MMEMGGFGGAYIDYICTNCKPVCVGTRSGHIMSNPIAGSYPVHHTIPHFRRVGASCAPPRPVPLTATSCMTGTTGSCCWDAGVGREVWGNTFGDCKCGM